MRCKYNTFILCAIALSLMVSSCEDKNKDTTSASKLDDSASVDRLISPMKKEVLSESDFKEVDKMLSAWYHTEWEASPEVNFLKKINQDASVKGIVVLWTHSLPIKDKSVSLTLDAFYKLAQPLSIDGKILTNGDESQAYIKIKDGVFLVYKNKDVDGSVSATFYRDQKK